MKQANSRYDCLLVQQNYDAFGIFSSSKFVVIVGTATFRRDIADDNFISLLGENNSGEGGASVAKKSTYSIDSFSSVLVLDKMFNLKIAPLVSKVFRNETPMTMVGLVLAT